MTSSYVFYGHDTKAVKPIDSHYAAIRDQRHMYDILSGIWSAETCAPRMRANWSKEDKTLGQCSITSFLIQDIFGGEVYGIPLPAGGFHCYNVVDGQTFDLTSEQFHGEKLSYENNPIQTRAQHFDHDADKFSRYQMLKNGVEKYLSENK